MKIILKILIGNKLHALETNYFAIFQNGWNGDGVTRVDSPVHVELLEAEN